MWLCVLLSATIAWASPDYSEPALLWEQAQADYEAHRFQEAYLKLKRLTEKYPTDSHHTASLLMLGHSALEAEHLDDARRALRKVIVQRSHQSDGHQARIYLVRTDLRQNRNKNALLTAMELDHEKNLDPALRSEGLIFKSLALLASRQALAAERALDSAQEGEVTSSSARLTGLERYARMQWKLQSCSLPSKHMNSETGVRHAMETQGTCLLEALSILRTLNAQPDFWERDRWRLKGAEAWSQAFDRFWESCETPPPPPTKPKRTSAQIAAWRSELKDFLLSACNQTRTQAISFLGPFQDGADLQLLRHSLEK